jgi:predicted secreted protein
MTRSSAAVSVSRIQTPLSITAIGLYMLFGACLMAINIFLRAPAFLMGIGFSGWKATVFFLALGTLDAGIGIGLLRLASWSRIVALYFFLFRIINTTLTFLLPGSRSRFEEGIAAMQTALGQQSAPRSPTWFGAVVELSVMAVVVWFLFTSKKAFVAANT